MNNKIFELINTLARDHTLELSEYEFLIENYSRDAAELLASLAVKERQAVYGNSVYIRGLIEVSNICKKDCLYCGIRRSNKNCDRYRLTSEEILSCVEIGYPLGFRTFVLQGGEDAYFSDDILCSIITSIKDLHPDCAVTLSLGERSRESYQRLFNAGANRYLLRHETADSQHYGKLHPPGTTLEERMRCLHDLREIGYQTGCGFMVGSPFQTNSCIAADLKFIETFSPDMCGIGPFIPHKDTPFAQYTAGTLDMTCYLLSIVRLIKPNILLPSTTALGTIDPFGREKGILSGANVVMPNLSPLSVRDKYALYNNKLSSGGEDALKKKLLEEKMSSIGYEIVTDRGDIKK